MQDFKTINVKMKIFIIEQNMGINLMELGLSPVTLVKEPTAWKQNGGGVEMKIGRGVEGGGRGVEGRCIL